jgi:hypothetical protein
MSNCRWGGDGHTSVPTSDCTLAGGRKAAKKRLHRDLATNHFTYVRVLRSESYIYIHTSHTRQGWHHTVALHGLERNAWGGRPRFPRRLLLLLLLQIDELLVAACLMQKLRLVGCRDPA